MAAASETTAPRRRFAVPRWALPYLLSLPALLVCIAILVPFFTAVFYSLQRYRICPSPGTAA